jgi:hypothetical protein
MSTARIRIGPGFALMTSSPCLSQRTFLPTTNAVEREMSRKHGRQECSAQPPCQNRAHSRQPAYLPSAWRVRACHANRSARRSRLHQNASRQCPFRHPKPATEVAVRHKFAPNRNQGIDPVHLWHLQVHQSDVRPMRPELFDGLAPIRRFANQTHILLIGDERRDSFAYQSEKANWDRGPLRNERPDKIQTAPDSCGPKRTAPGKFTGARPSYILILRVPQGSPPISARTPNCPKYKSAPSPLKQEYSVK